MIRNIVFDMGNVLMSWNPERIVTALPVQESHRALLQAQLLEGPEWIRVDEGSMSEQELMQRVCERLPKEAHADAQYVMAHWHEQMKPLDDMYQLVKELKAAGYHLYLLSNTSKRFRVYENEIPAFHLLDGRFISADFKCIKPSPMIYEKFLQHFGLRPEECLFIDDMRANIEGGKAAKMDGILYTGDVNQLRQELAEHGVTVQTQLQFVKVDSDKQLQRLSEIADEVWHQHFASILTQEQIEYMVEKFQSYPAMKRQIEEEGYEYFFFREADDGVHQGHHGYMGFRVQEEALFLSKLYLLQAYRGRGLSSQALAFLISIAQNRGCRKIWLTVNRFNAHTIEVYRHWGFQTVREQCADIGHGFVMDDYIMELEVPDWR